jgi:pimeloyl-ACP methyl ester carboxylesterase
MLYQTTSPFINSSYVLVPSDPLHPELSTSIAIHYRIWTRDELVNPYRFCLLLHGYAGSTFSWRNQPDALLEKHDLVVAVDLPGFGFSSRESNLIHTDIRRAYWIYYVCKYIENLYNCSEVRNNSIFWSLIGHGMGAKVVSSLVLVWNEQEKDKPLSKIENVVLVNPESYELETNHTVQDRLLGRIPGIVLTPTILNLLILRSSCVRYMLHKYCYNRLPTDEEVEGYVKPLTVPRSAECIIDMFEFTGYKQGVDIKATNRLVPRLMMVCGERDEAIPIEDHVKLFSLIQQDEIDNKIEYKDGHEPACLQVIMDASHSVMETHAEEFNKVVNNFFQFPKRETPRRMQRRNSSRFFMKVVDTIKQIL